MNLKRVVERDKVVPARWAALDRETLFRLKVVCALPFQAGHEMRPTYPE